MIGETLGSYRILNQIGAGGMGVVYYAEHVLIGRKAAIKLLLPELSTNPELVDRFFNEARAATVINHPGLCDVFDFGYHPVNGSAFIVMAFLEGESLASRLRRDGKLPAALVVSLARQIAQALNAAHEHHIVHRDLKPDNLFLCPDPAVPTGIRAKVLDFGIAKLAGDGSQSLKTRTGSVMGTPTYMAPEQCRGAGTVDRRADIYALGCIVYEMLCGRPPYLGEGIGEILGKHMYEEPPPPRAYEPSIPPALEAVVLRALSKKPDDRQQSMDELAAEMDSAVPRADGSIVTSPGMPAMAAPSTPGMAHPVTTLGAGAGQFGTVPPAPYNGATVNGGGKGKFALIGAVVLVAGGVALYASGIGRGGGETATTGDQTVTANTGTTATPDPEPQPAEAVAIDAAPVVEDKTASADDGPVAPATIKLAIESVPSGADVYRLADGLRVGKTPFEQSMSPSAGEAIYVVKLAGYDDARVALDASADRSETVTLARKGAAKASKAGKDGKAAKAGKGKIGGHSSSGSGALDPFNNHK